MREFLDKGTGWDAILSAGTLGGISIIGARESSIPLDILVWMGIADDFKLQGIFLKSFHYPEGESCPPFNALLYVRLADFDSITANGRRGVVAAAVAIEGRCGIR